MAKLFARFLCQNAGYGGFACSGRTEKYKVGYLARIGYFAKKLAFPKYVFLTANLGKILRTQPVCQWRRHNVISFRRFSRYS